MPAVYTPRRFGSDPRAGGISPEMSRSPCSANHDRWIRGRALASSAARARPSVNDTQLIMQLDTMGVAVVARFAEVDSRGEAGPRSNLGSHVLGDYLLPVSKGEHAEGRVI